MRGQPTMRGQPMTMTVTQPMPAYPMGSTTYVTGTIQGGGFVNEPNDVPTDVDEFTTMQFGGPTDSMSPRSAGLANSPFGSSTLEELNQLQNPDFQFQ